MPLIRPLSRLVALLIAAAAATPALAEAPEWAMQPAESALTFTATQSGSPIEGRFEEFEAAIRFDPEKPEAGSVTVEIVMASATTDSADRDATIKSAALFNVADHPSATFVADRFERGEGENAYAAPGTLTLRGVSKPATLPFTLVIEGEGAGATARAQGGLAIDRLDYGVGQGDWEDTSLVANRVEIAIDITAVRQ
ncbi:MAG: YceI family protein [Alphaproteobacteria bacterium]|nr:YceI family protein [Alphaproteobacteria bacterium]